jgi:hypothetical protein
VLLTAFGGGEETLGGTNWPQALLVATACVAQPLILVRSGRMWNRWALATGVVLFVGMVNAVAAHGGTRYLVAVILIGYALTGGLLACVARLGRAGALLAVTVSAVIFGVLNLRPYTDIPGLLAAEELSRLADTQAAVAALDERGLRFGYADYWSAYPITFVSAERIIVAPALPLDFGPGTDRYPAYSRQVAISPTSQVFLLIDEHCAVDGYLSALEQAGATYRYEEVGRWFLISHIEMEGGLDGFGSGPLESALRVRTTSGPLESALRVRTTC